MLQVDSKVIDSRCLQCCRTTMACLMADTVSEHTATSLHTYIHPFNGPFSGTTWVSRYQKGKANLDFTEARDSEWHWHQLGNMQVCISLQYPTTLKFFTGRMPFLSPNQQRQSTEGTATSLHYVINCLCMPPVL